MSYEAVIAILRNSVPQPWPENVAPEPKATARALQTMSPNEIAARLESYLWGIAQTQRPPYPLTTQLECYVWVRYRTFAKGREYWSYGTALALGLITEQPVDQVAGAQSVSEWLANQSNDRNRLGYVLFTDTESSKAEKARRLAKAAAPPYEWSALGKQLHWQLAVMEGYIPATLDALSEAYACKTPALDDIRKLDAQCWLDNLRCDDEHRPRKWNPDGSLNPDFAGF